MVQDHSNRNKLQPLLIEVVNPPPQRRSVIVLDQADERTALEVAQKVAAATGRPVTIKNEDMVELRTIPAPTIQ